MKSRTPTALLRNRSRAVIQWFWANAEWHSLCFHPAEESGTARLGLLRYRHRAAYAGAGARDIASEGAAILSAEDVARLRITLTVAADGKIEARPINAITPEFARSVRRHKVELLAALAEVEAQTKSGAHTDHSCSIA